MWNGFFIYPLHLSYNFQDFEPIEYVNDLFWSLPIFQANDPKVHINLDDFPFLSKLVIQKPHIQLS